MTGACLLSIIVITHNEADLLESCMRSLLDNGLEHEPWEILFVDGGSTDGTREIIDRHVAALPRARVVENPRRYKPIGLNLGIRASSGEYVMRIDAHATYAPDYVRRCLDRLRATGAHNVGGIRETHVPVGASVLEQALAIAVSDPVAVGDSHYRTGRAAQPRYVDTVYCGCYPREVFTRVGLFNEELLRTQDRELNLRLRRSGGRILLDPGIRCTYHARTRLRSYLAWNSAGAYWLGRARRFTTTPMLARRNLVPAGFALYLGAWAVAVAAIVAEGAAPWLVAACSVPLV